MNDINKVIISGYVSKDFEIVKKDFQVKDGKTVIEVNFQLLSTTVYQDNIKNDYVMCNVYNDLAIYFYDNIKKDDYIVVDGVLTGYKYTTEYGETKLIMKLRCHKIIKRESAL